MSEHVVPVKVYVAVYATLVFMTALTTWISFQDLGIFNPIAALSIATFKASLVLLFFMHVRYSSRLTWLVIFAALFWLAILLSLTLGDYLTRPWLA